MKNLFKRVMAFFQNRIICPNCDNIIRKNDWNGIEFITGQEFAVCINCVRKPTELDEEKIVRSLSKFGWTEEYLKLAKEAVVHCKQNGCYAWPLE